jgi:integrase
VHQQAERVTFDECASAYIYAHRGSWKSAKHAAQWETTIAAYVSPIIGALPVAEVDTALVVKVLRPIWTTKTEIATRLRGRIESILDWATTHKFRRDENPARWRGHLESLLANPNKIAPVNHPALPWREIGAFMTELRKREGVSARAIEFAILTVCRSGEVRGARWSEIDLDAKLWTIPGERMKAGKEHRVPQSTSAVAILAAIERHDGLVFPGRDKDALLSDMSLTSVLRRMERTDITVHGFRSTFRDWCSEYGKNAFSREVCEHALAHGLLDKVEAAYRRGDLLEKRVTLMQAWADYCGGVE